MTDLPPDPDGPSLEATVRGRARPRARTLARRIVGLVVVGLLLAAGAVAVTGAGGASSDRYRTATAATRTVAEVLDAVATVEPVAQASVGFPVAGTVTSVAVRTGDTVATGQTLATLDTDDLQDAVDSARAQLAQAQLTLERALDGEDVSGPSGGGIGTVAVTPAAYTRAGADDTATASSEDDALRPAQQAVLDAQSQVTVAMGAAQAALDSASAICAATGEDDDPTACTDALGAALVSQQEVTAAQTALVDAAAVLTDLLAQRADDGGGDGPPGDPADSGAGPEGSAPDGALPSGTGGTGATEAPESTTSSPTATELIAHQKAVDAAAADLAAAEQAVGQATIVSPIAGTVVAVGLAEGDEVTAGSSTATVVVAGEGGYEVTTMVSVDDLPEIEVGQAARVTPDGDGAPLDGQVVRVGLAGTASGSTTSYPVTIGLTDDASGLGNGATASVTVTTARATEAVAVPTSAVTAQGGRHTVQVLEGTADDEPRSVTVEVGAVGDTWTEVRSGVEAGDVVVVADLEEPLPGSATDGSSSTGGGGAVFPGGGGGFPGGARGGPPGGG